MASNQAHFSLLSLNVHGIRNNKKRNKIFNWLIDHNVHNSVSFLQETHSDYKTQANWDRDWPGLTFFSHGTTHSAGVIIHIGKNLEFKMTDKIIDTNGRFIILLCEVQCTKYLFVNVYAPNTENLQLQFLSEVEQCIASLNTSKDTFIVWGGDFNSHFTDIDADGGSCLIKQRSVNKLESIMFENDLCDIWRIQNENVRQYTWRSLNPLIQRRLDYLLISNNMQPFVQSSKIINAIATDHAAVILFQLVPYQRLIMVHYTGNLIRHSYQI